MSGSGGAGWPGQNLLSGRRSRKRDRGDPGLFRELGVRVRRVEVEPGNDPGPSSHQDPTDRVFITDDEPAPRSFHDPRRFYEDLR
jgi:hypothetical protein